MTDKNLGFVQVKTDVFLRNVERALAQIPVEYDKRFAGLVTVTADNRTVSYRKYWLFGTKITKEITDERFLEIVSNDNVALTDDEKYVIKVNSLDVLLTVAESYRSGKSDSVVMMQALKLRCEGSPDFVEVSPDEVHEVATLLWSMDADNAEAASTGE